MQFYGDRGDLTVGCAPSWCLDPLHCDHTSANGRKCPKCMSIPHLPDAESGFLEGTRSLWVYYPQGILRRHMAETDMQSRYAADAISHLPRGCGGAKSADDIAAVHESVPYPGHSLFQDSFFLCKFKKIGDQQELSDVYVEIVMDGYSGMAFAKVYATENAMCAADIMTTRVAPFFKRQGVPVERVLTRKTNEYLGLAPIHPFETVLGSLHIQHGLTDHLDHTHMLLCERFFTFLHREFLGRALRHRYHHSLETLQRELDDFVNKYNTSLPSFASEMHGNFPLRAFPQVT
jgi:hypothetical protein